MQLREVGEDFCGMRRHIGDHVDVADDTGVVDQERMPSREVGILIIRRSDDVVGSPHPMVDVAQQGVLESLRLGELEVLGGSIERRTDDGAVGFGEPCGTVTQCLSFDRSTRCRSLRIPPQQHPAAAEVGKAGFHAVLIG